MISPQAGSKNVLNSWHWAGLQLGFYSWSQSSFYLITKSIFDLIDKLTSSLRKLSSFYWIRRWKWIYNCSFSSEIFFFFFLFVLWQLPSVRESTAAVGTEAALSKWTVWRQRRESTQFSARVFRQEILSVCVWVCRPQRYKTYNTTSSSLFSCHGNIGSLHTSTLRLFQRVMVLRQQEIEHFSQEWRKENLTWWSVIPPPGSAHTSLKHLYFS